MSTASETPFAPVAAESPSTGPTPENFGPYRVFERIGMGGMATVHRALERGIEGFERIVALKRLLPHLAEDEDFVRSFVREAKLASLLGHPNIVQLFELGRVGTTYFISMEYIRGRDLRQILRQARRLTGPPPMHVVAALMLELLDALEYAHTRCDESGNPLSIVHRDISPSNLLVSQSGRLKIIDFGIAKASLGRLETHTGRIKGKLSYMAPESFASGTVDGRSDLFSAAVIAHELTVARPLFAAKNDFQTIDRVQHMQIPLPSQLNTACPHEFDAWVLRGLSRDPATRWPSASNMRAALEHLISVQGWHCNNREVTEWIEWAFSQSSASISSVMPAQARGKDVTPYGLEVITGSGVLSEPHSESLDALMDVVWGGPAKASSGVVLPEVPDVSQRHQANSGSVATDNSAPEPLAAPTMVDAHGGKFGFGSIPPPIRPPTESTRVVRGTKPPAQNRITFHSPGAATGPLDAALRAVAKEREAVSGSSLANANDAVHGSPTEPMAAQGMAVQPLASASISDSFSAIPTRDAGVGLPFRFNADALPTEDELHPVYNVRSSREILTETNFVPAPWRYAFRKVLAALFAVALVSGAGICWLMLRKTSAPLLAKVRFQVEPADAELVIDGHPVVGQLQLPAGTHQFEVRKNGYESWVSSLEIRAGETQTVAVALRQGASETARLVLDSTPPGLSVLLDDTTALTTPVDTELPPGRHSLVVRDGEAEIWKHSFEASANTKYQFHPMVSAPAIADAPTEKPEPSRDLRHRENKSLLPMPRVRENGILARPTEIKADAKNDSKNTGSSFLDTLTLDPINSVASSKPKPPKQETAATAPQMVPSSSMRKLVGATPAIRSRGEKLPTTLNAKLCVDVTGAVVSVVVKTPASDRVKSELSATLLGWRYEPYEAGGRPVPACFGTVISVSAR